MSYYYGEEQSFKSLAALHYPGATWFRESQWQSFYAAGMRRLPMAQESGVAVLEQNGAQASYSHGMSASFLGILGGAGCRCCCCCEGGFDHRVARRIEEDQFGIGSCGQGARSNLANSPEVMLALNDIFSGGANKSYEDAAKELKEKYGIEAEVADIKTKGHDGTESTRKGLRFANGDYFVDTNGDNQLGNADYKFADAVKNLKEKYGVDDEYLKRYVEAMKERGKIMSLYTGGSTGGDGARLDFAGMDPFASSLLGSGALGDAGYGGQERNYMLILLLFLAAHTMAR